MAKRKRAPTGKKTRTEPPIEPSKTGLNGTIKANTVKTPKSIAEWVPTWLTIDRFLSILAIFLSVTLPLIAYFLLDPQLQGFRNRGKIELSVIPEPGRFAFPGQQRHPQIEIKNIGNLPAKDVVVTLRYHEFLQGDHSHDSSGGHSAMTRVEPGFRFLPPVDFEMNATEFYHAGGQFVLRLKDPIGPQKTVSLSFFAKPCVVWATSDTGEVSTVDLHEIIPDYDHNG